MIDRPALARILAQVPVVVRVVIAAYQGSSPREAGAAMLVWDSGQEGTIGGGALEFAAAAKARTLLAGGGPQVERVALGPALGQCCGGAVTLVYERFTAVDLGGLPESGLYPRRIEGTAEMPMSITRALRQARGQGMAQTMWKSGWLAEPVTAPTRALWIWGAGHVGRALVSVLHPLPGLGLTWIDTTPARFPTETPPGVTQRVHENPAAVVNEAPAQAEHLIVTYSHTLDLELCHRLLTHGFGGAGLIGSASKWARFRNRLRALGHQDAQISRIQCPIGAPELGKHPQAIAVGVAVALLNASAMKTHQQKAAG
ncbi:MAG: xanthine dehydrogenase accessory protein XdhC [Pararhodobacter sp.]|nr:xanthine dehydrogenase accessory protein XdhC [Pararhodobacter sp.]